MIREATIFDKDRINELGKLINRNYARLFKLNEILSERYSKI